MQRRPVSAIIFGILNIGFAVFSWIELLLFKPLAAIMAKGAAAELGLLHWQWIAALVDAVAGLAQVAAGVGLLAGKIWGRILSIVWGGFDVLFCLARFPLNLDTARNTLTAVHINPAAEPVLTSAIAVVATVASMIFPALLIYFMTRPKIKAAYSATPSAA